MDWPVFCKNIYKKRKEGDFCVYFLFIPPRRFFSRKNLKILHHSRQVASSELLFTTQVFQPKWSSNISPVLRQSGEIQNKSLWKEKYHFDNWICFSGQAGLFDWWVQLRWKLPGPGGGRCGGQTEITGLSTTYYCLATFSSPHSFLPSSPSPSSSPSNNLVFPTILKDNVYHYFIQDARS